MEGEQQSWPLAVSIQGSFDSFFQDRESPFEEPEVLTATVEQPLGTIQASPESARLVVIGSTEFIDDTVLEISSRLSADRYLNNLQFMQNAVDWSLEDQDLLTIRSRGTYARLLDPLDKGQQSTWEVANYALALVALVVIAGVWTLRRRNEQPMPLVEPKAAGESAPESAAGGSDE